MEEKEISKQKRVNITASLSPSPQDSQYQFTCVSCLYPNEKLYNSSIKNLKLTSCPSCLRDVDPYIEREFILVGMDMILLQRQAYRHALCNRHLILPPYGWMNEAVYSTTNMISDTAVAEDEQVTKIKKMKTFTMILLPILLTTMTKHQNHILLSPPSSPLDNRSSTLSSPPVSFFFMRANVLFPLMSVSIFEFILVWFGTIHSAHYLLRHRDLHLYPERHAITSEQNTQQKKARTVALQLGIFLPQLFHIATLLVQIYDQSRQVRTLGSIFVFLFLYISIDTIMERDMHWSDLKYGNNKKSSRGQPNIQTRGRMTKVHSHVCTWVLQKIPAFPLLLGLTLRWIIPRLFTRCLKEIWITILGMELGSHPYNWNILESHFSGNLVIELLLRWFHVMMNFSVSFFI